MAWWMKSLYLVQSLPDFVVLLHYINKVHNFHSINIIACQSKECNVRTTRQKNIWSPHTTLICQLLSRSSQYYWELQEKTWFLMKVINFITRLLHVTKHCGQMVGTSVSSPEGTGFKSSQPGKVLCNFLEVYQANGGVIP